MRILAIETSCDETALSLIEASGTAQNPSFTILENIVSSQVALHAQYGGVFPMMAKREHAKNIGPILKKLIAREKLKSTDANLKKRNALQKILEREPELFTYFEKEILPLKKPKIDLIVVTRGPGLEPTLWVGINFARALAKLWDIPIVGANHMEGHAISPLIATLALGKKSPLEKRITFPALALLVSGGHTELVIMRDWAHYKIVGATRDDAAGEAFDKVARMLALPYPDGPEISLLAAASREKLIINNSKLKIKKENKITFPRPMINSSDFDFSFSGLKTAVLYYIRDLKTKLTPTVKSAIAREFEDAVVDVLVGKTIRAAQKYKVRSVLVGGGVAGNTELRARLAQTGAENKIPVFFSTRELATDNSVMIGMAGYFAYLKKGRADNPDKIKAEGNLKLN